MYTSTPLRLAWQLYHAGVLFGNSVRWPTIWVVYFFSFVLKTTDVWSQSSAKELDTANVVYKQAENGHIL
jgi:hypothetical protein